MMIGGQLEGLEATGAALQALDKKVRTKIARKALNKASKPILRDAKANWPVDSGQSRKSLGRRVKVSRQGGTVSVYIGPRHGFKALVVGQDGKPRVEDPAKIGHLIEAPTAAHAIGKGSSRRRKQAKGGMHPGTRGAGALKAAWSKNEGPAAATIQTEIARGIEEAASQK